MKANFKKYILDFKRPSGTSRGILTQKETWFIFIEENGKRGVGECGLLRGLSIDDRLDYEEKLAWTCQNIHLGLTVLWEDLLEFPSIQFGLEMAFLSLHSDEPFVLFSSDFTHNNAAIPINGLIWMEDQTYMKHQIETKISEGFKCVKLKIGALDFNQEIELIRFIRSQFSVNDIEIRLDANGAFHPENALDKLIQLSKFDIHSIEQPIAKNQFSIMKMLCEKSPIPIALDEELIGVFKIENKRRLLEEIQPQYIILKPSFIGGIKGSLEWIQLAEALNINWWVTSALESNVGLNAISQWTYTLNNPMPQGLGTGALYTNNFDSPLEVKKGQLYYNALLDWNFML